MTSAERVVDYSNLKKEASGKFLPDSDWPKNGTIQAKEVSMKYADDLPNSLQSLNFEIHSKEKV